jgi:glycosyltransferase involved in cell wall biosynthesis
MSQPCVSVVIPLFNKEPYVARTIESVLVQTLENFEVIVIDDGSTDDGPGIVSRIHDHRVRLIHQQNEGVSSARNRGIKEAAADLIAFLDADDVWMPEFLAIIMRLKAVYPAAGAYVTAHRISKGDDVHRNVIAPGFAGASRMGLVSDYFASAHKMFIHTSSVAVQRKVFDRIGGFRVGYAMGEDVDMWFRIAAYYVIAYCSTVASVWRYTCKTRLPEERSPLSESMRAIEASSEMPAEIKKQARLFWTRILMCDAREFCLAGRKDIARRLLRETNYLTSPLSMAHTVAFMALPVSLLTGLARQRVWLTRIILKSAQIVSRTRMQVYRNV